MNTANFPTLRPGDRGQDVRYLQQNLHDRWSSGLFIDGIFGNDTEQTVIDFQRQHYLPVNGIVGILTWSELLTIRRIRY